ncbi:MAG: hypothetical protein IJA70_08100 [Oscillospiraceae bacterium]|nr:hypothetical protein [Oscillospiraceae bacterium]MBQ7036757.1 hypothetical protein [Clostridia bacterium]
MKKKLIASILFLTMAVSLFAGCAKTPKADPKVKAALDGKKVLFVGNSFTYYGGVVARTAETNLDPVLANRVNDQGYFYQLCKAHGAEVNVVDWTFGGHGLEELLGTEPCETRPPCEGKTPSGHLAFLTDRTYDYVILSQNRCPDDESAEETLENVKDYAKIFKDANPDVKLFYVVHDGVYAVEYGSEWLKAVSLIEKEGITVLDWGTLVWDVATGKTQVPGAKESYNKSSFIVSKEPGDGYHPNPLTGYLFALMTFSAITGLDAVGQPYDFCYKEESGVYPISLWLQLDYFKETYYRYDDKETPDVNERQTNFIEVFNSEADMKGLQSLVNTYLADDTNAWEKYITE